VTTMEMPDFASLGATSVILSQTVPAARGQETARNSQLTVPFSTIPAIPASYLWPGVLPRRTPVMIAAPGGTGKGLAIAAIIGLVTTGQPFPSAAVTMPAQRLSSCDPGEPEGTARKPGAVIIVAPEDDPNEDLAFRLTAAGADLSLVYNLTYLPDGSLFKLPENLPELRRAITAINKATGPGVALIALDPLLAMCTRNLSTAINARGVIEPLQEIARDENIAMIISHHTVKSGAIASNKALTDAMRAVWLISKAGNDDNGRVMTPWKTNRKGMTIRYWITGEGESVRAVFASPGDDSAIPGSRAAKLRLGETGITMPRPLFAIANDVIRSWRPPDMAARPFIKEMLLTTSVTDPRAGMTGEEVIRGFLASADEFTGPAAEAIKKELRGLLP
jgi:hypothetical protein